MLGGMGPLSAKADEVSDRLMGFASFSAARLWATSASRHSVMVMDPIADRCMERTLPCLRDLPVAIIDRVPQFLKPRTE